MTDLTISLLHLALKPGALRENCALVEQGICASAQRGADLVIAPELCISGYEFPQLIGAGWIATYPDEWARRIAALASSLNLPVLFGHAERGANGRSHNTAFMLNGAGELIGRHRKINTHAERWADPGVEIAPVSWKGLSLGILICSDAYSREVADTHKSKGAHLLLSPSAWGPGLNGPAGEWEQRTMDTGLPLIVCNRTGLERSLNFGGAESLVIHKGARLLSHSSKESASLTLKWSLERMLPSSTEFEVLYL